MKIMGGQNLEATPHMKFFWEQQMKLLQSEKMGRRYHPQIIHFALSLHGKSPAAYKELRDSELLFSQANEYTGTIKTILNQRLVLIWTKSNP